MTLLTLEDVARGYRTAGEQVRAVDGVTIDLDDGEMVALHGPSGSGKTTLLLLIAKLLRPDRGTIRYRGRDLDSFSPAATAHYLRREVGFVHHGFQLMPGASALENACVKLLLDGLAPRQARARAKPWLERLGLAERANHTPDQLSGGERQRVAIARALVGEPRLVLADEPTGNLDRLRSLQTVDLLRSIAHEHGAATVLVTHDTDAAAVADREYALCDGQLTPAEALG